MRVELLDEADVVAPDTASQQKVMNPGLCHPTCSWGVHTCELNVSYRESDEAVLGRPDEDNLGNDFKLCGQKDGIREEIVTAYHRKYPNYTGQVLDPGLFNVFAAIELSYPDGKFYPRSAHRGLDESCEYTQLQGSRSVRATGEVVMEALQTNPFTISGGMITKNLHCLEPDEWPRINIPEFRGRQELP